MPRVQEREMKPTQQRLICDCGGELRSCGTALLSQPPKYPHICLACGVTTYETTQYPCIVYFEVENG